MPEILIDKSIPVIEIAFKDKEGCIIKCAQYIRDDILDQAKHLPELTWPPTLEELNQVERNPPKSLPILL